MFLVSCYPHGLFFYMQPKSALTQYIGTSGTDNRKTEISDTKIFSPHLFLWQIILYSPACKRSHIQFGQNKVLVRKKHNKKSLLKLFSILFELMSIPQEHYLLAWVILPLHDWQGAQLDVCNMHCGQFWKHDPRGTKALTHHICPIYGWKHELLHIFFFKRREKKQEIPFKQGEVKVWLCT